MFNYFLSAKTINHEHEMKSDAQNAHVNFAALKQLFCSFETILRLQRHQYQLPRPLPMGRAQATETVSVRRSIASDYQLAILSKK